MEIYKDLICQECNQTFKKRLGDYNKPDSTNKFCSNKCSVSSRKTSKSLSCEQCGNIFEKTLSQIKKTKRHFCSQSCAAKYNNAHKTKGTTVSKLEAWLQERLNLLYPKLNILYNDKETIKSELDIYIPSLQLAFELNGVFHYEPIFGRDKLTSIQENDKKKFHLCVENEIDLCVIDTTSQKHFTKKSSEKFLSIITNIIDQRM